MAARGARGRKDMEKKIHKEEKKQAQQDILKQFEPASDIAGGWGLTSKRSSLSSDGATSLHNVFRSSSRQAPRSRSGSVAPSSIAPSDSVSSIDANRTGKKYSAATGKATSAPRGRGAGVPNKAPPLPKNRVTSPTHDRENPYASSVTSAASKPETKTWQGMKLWAGNGRPPQPYKGFDQDPDLWIPNGDCLVYFSEETNIDNPRPALRVHVDRLRRANSIFINNLLRYGEVFQGADDSPPPSRHDFDRAPSPDPLTLSNLVQHTSGPGGVSQSDDMSDASYGSPTSANPNVRSYGGLSPKMRNPSPLSPITPPMSTATSEIASLGAHDPGAVTHEIWFRSPSHITKPHIQRRHHIATRNFIALLHGKGLVGQDYWEMLSDLQNVMETYYELNDPATRKDIPQMLVSYLNQRRLDDVRGNLYAAIGLLAWCEQPSVQWEQGYFECFIHAAGMLGEREKASAEFKNLSRITRLNLDTAYSQMQLRMIDAEDKLTTFEFSDMFQTVSVPDTHPARRSFQHLRERLISYYHKAFGSWPPKETVNGRWINREIVRRLQNDFAMLFEYLVNRDVTWDGQEDKHNWNMRIVCKDTQRSSFTADFPGLPYTAMLVGFDSRHNYKHLPNPYPLLPEVKEAPKEKEKRSLFSNLKKNKQAPVADDKGVHTVRLAFSQTNNLNKMGSSFEENDLLDTFQSYEQTLQPALSSIPHHEARMGRWILIYGVLQTLSTISVDTAGLKWKDTPQQNIKYFLNPSLAGCPPWKANGFLAAQHDPNRYQPPNTTEKYVEANQNRSYCWLAPHRWNNPHGGVRSAFGQFKFDTPTYDLEAEESADVLSELDGRNIHPNMSLPIVHPSSSYGMHASHSAHNAAAHSPRTTSLANSVRSRGSNTSGTSSFAAYPGPAPTPPPLSSLPALPSPPPTSSLPALPNTPKLGNTHKMSLPNVDNLSLFPNPPGLAGGVGSEKGSVVGSPGSAAGVAGWPGEKDELSSGGSRLVTPGVPLRSPRRDLGREKERDRTYFGSI